MSLQHELQSKIITANGKIEAVELTIEQCSDIMDEDDINAAQAEIHKQHAIVKLCKQLLEAEYGIIAI